MKSLFDFSKEEIEAAMEAVKQGKPNPLFENENFHDMVLYSYKTGTPEQKKRIEETIDFLKDILKT
jgi:pyruvate-formate lyase-activating enzyme